MDTEILIQSARASLDRGCNFLVSQISATQLTWGNEPGDPPDPWPSAQIAFFLPSSRYRGLVRNTLTWLSEHQAPDGSWWSNTYGEFPDTGATACCTIALLHHEGASSISGQRGIAWLCDRYESGWINQPENPNLQDVHYYSTAYAIRALVRAPRRPVQSLTIRSGIGVLERAQSEAGGWGFHVGGAPDPSFTCYAMHGLLDAVRIGQVPVASQRIVAGIKWLIQQQNKNGSWSDWRGVTDSPEATAYGAYILLSSDAPASAQISRAIEWLIRHQSVDGSWGLETKTNEPPINWVTNIVISALKAFLIASEEGLEPTLPIHDGMTCIPKGLDHFSASLDPDTANLPNWYARLIRPASPEEEETDLGELYASVIADTVQRVPFTRSLDHTMFRALDTYVNQKLPVREIGSTLEKGELLEIFGVYPDHLTEVAGPLGLHEIEFIPFHHKKEARFNHVRPTFFFATRDGHERFLGAAVVPGRDYVLHYASLIRHAAREFTQRADEMIRVHRFPTVENHLPAWTRLGTNFVAAGDCVLIGYVEDLRAAFLENEFNVDDWTENDYYGVSRIKLPDGSSLKLLGVKYCFWGSISAVLCHQLCELGAREIIYIAKLGALTTPDDLYERIFCPSSYAILNHTRQVASVEDVPNGILTWRPELATGLHVSIPTVLEEDYEQRATTIALRAQSIDNEISQIAKTVSIYNGTHETTVKFSAVHFATDYVRTPKDKALDTSHDLATNRSVPAREAKNRILKRIYDQVLAPYVLQM